RRGAGEGASLEREEGKRPVRVHARQDGVRESLLLLYRRCRFRTAVYQGVQLRTLGDQVVLERTRMGQAAVGQAQDHLRGLGQRLSIVRCSGETAADLRLLGTGAD